MKKQLLLFALALLPTMASAFAGEVEIDGINYFIKTGGQYAEVRPKNPKYSGDVVIPPSIEYEGVTCNVIKICDNAFSGSTGLTSVTIPNSVTSIGQYAFQYCTSLTSITIPNSVTYIGEWAFYGCSGLTSVTIPNSVTRILNYVFQNCTNLTTVTIPNNVTYIAGYAFKSCTSLTCVTIPNNVTYIGEGAFEGCSILNSITIGTNVTRIDQNAFGYCPDLTHVYCNAINVPNTNYGAFTDSYPQYATLHVPDESVDAYRNSDPWYKFGTIVGLSVGGGNNKCEKPTISYQGGKLVFNCATSGATCHSSITDADISSFEGNEVQLTVTYNVSVYATMTGMENSDIAYATLCWIDKEPTITNDIGNAIEFSATPVLIQSDGGQLTIQGVDDGTPIYIYTSAGIQAGSTVSKAGTASIPTSMKPGSIAIVKIGSKSVKVVIK